MSSSMARVILSFLLLFSVCKSFAAEENESAGGIGARIRIGVAILEPRFHSDTTRIDIITVGPFPINVDFHSPVEFKSINIAAEITSTICSEFVRMFSQTSCIPFPMQSIVDEFENSKDLRNKYDIAKSAMARHNATLQDDQKVDVLLVLRAGQYAGNQVVSWGGFAILFAERKTIFFESRGYQPHFTFIAYQAELLDSAAMKNIVFGNSMAYKEIPDIRIQESEFSSYINRLPDDHEIESSIRANISGAAAKLVKNLDTAVWVRYQDRDPWEVIKKRRGG